MKRLLILLLSSVALSQGVRYDIPPILTSVGKPVSLPVISLCPGTATVSGAACSPATGQSTTDITNGTLCPIGSPVTLTGLNTCQATGDMLGNAGFWLKPGAYIYCITGSGVAGSCFNLTVPIGTTSAGGPSMPSATITGALTAASLNGAILVQLSPTCANIQTAINTANAAGGGWIILPAIAQGAMDCVSTSLTSHSNIHIRGQGMGATVLQWSGSGAIGFTFPDTGGTSYASIEDLTIFFTTAAGAAIGIKGQGFNDPQNFSFNTIRNVAINNQTLTSGSIGLNLLSSGAAVATQVFMNRIENVNMLAVDSAITCTGCEGNFIQAQAYKSGKAASAMYSFGTSGAGAPSNNNHIDIRCENEVTGLGGCFSTTGNYNIVSMTHDSNFAIPAIVSDGNNSNYNIVLAGIVTVGTPATTSTLLAGSNVGQLPSFRMGDGTAGIPSLAYIADTTTGFSRPGSGFVRYSAAGVDVGSLGNNGFIIHNAKSYAYSTGDSFSNSVDLGTSRLSANLLSLDDGTIGDSKGSVKLQNVVSGGTAATLSGTGACATITTQVGGQIAGSAKCTGTTGASTLTITFTTTAPNGYTCDVWDETTRANVFQQTSHTTTTCVLTVTSVTQNDVFVFKAIAF